MAGVRSKPTQGGLWQAWFIDATGKKRFFTARSKTEARRMAEKLEDEHRQVRLGYRPPPLSADKHSKRPFVEVMEEYLAWGEAQGGRGGRSWGSTHARMRRTHLEGWQERLGLATLADLDGCLPRVEKALRELQARGRAGKTVANYAEALHSFCLWAEQRGYLAAEPLKALASFDTTPQTLRRAMTDEEIDRLFQACAPHRRLLYETAFLSGLRANELRSLTVDHLDREHSGLTLDAAWTKNRQAGFQPLPKALVARLEAFAESGEANSLYARLYARRDATAAPKNPLLYLPSHPARELDEDLKAAGIPKCAPGGKLDFHAFRLAYINFVIESGATVKEAQALARHASPELTMNVYGRVREERLAATVEKVAERLPMGKKGVPRVYRMAVGAETESATPFASRELRFKKMVEAAGLEPESPPSVAGAESPQDSDNPAQNQTLADSEQQIPEQKPALPAHQTDTSERSQGVPRVHQNTMTADLAQVVEAWDHLSDAVKAGILAMVNASK